MLLQLLLQFCLLLFVTATPIQRSSASTDLITYVLPIWEGSLASHDQTADLSVLSTMKSLLGLGGDYTVLGWSFSSWALSRDILGSDSNYTFDPTNLNYQLGLAVTSNLPILVHMNNGGWADCCTPNSDGGWSDILLDYIVDQPNTVAMDNTGASLFAHDGGHNHFTLSRLNDVYRSYKKRNVQAAAEVLANWAALNPSLFAGVSLDSETVIPQNQADYNPYFIQEWKEWLQNTGIYGPGGDYFGQGRVPAYTSIDGFNSDTGQNFASWDAMQPPSQITPGDLLSEAWEQWRVTVVIHSVSDETEWIATAGIDRKLIYGHQTSREDDYGFADDVQTETAANGAGGVTYYGWIPANFGELDNSMRAAGKNNWGTFEVNPMSSDPTTAYDTFVTLFNDGIKIMCPNSWESDEASPDIYAIFNSPSLGNTTGNALNQFLFDHGNSPRFLQPVPWNPGMRVYDFFDSFSSASLTGVDNHVESTGSVGNVVRKSVYSATPGTISYTVTLPSVSSGQRLNFWTSVGIKDGAGVGGETQFQVTFAGNNLFGEYFHLDKNYWVWKRWVPIMVDVTFWAGETVTVDLITTGNDTWGWTMWGSPSVYLTTTGNNLALGASVSVSSTDGDSAVWDPSYLTDGNVDGGTNATYGWSSVSYSTPAATEWAIIDLGSTQSIGKVVLFSRSDFGYAGTGFPTAFDIQGSTDSNTWTTLVAENDYPVPKSGDGQIFTFVQASARYVRIIATALQGVASESGYRFQMAEVEVYA